MRTSLAHRRRAVAPAVAFVATAVVLAMSGCSSSGTTTATGGSGTTITYLTHWGPEQVTQLKAAGTAFTAANPGVTVKVQAVPFGNLLSTLRTQGSSPNGPTIAGIYDLWLPALIKDGYAAAAPTDVDTDVKSNWSPNLAADVSANGKVYGIPNEVDLYALNYNKKLFTAAGISAPPKNWTELEADAKKLTDKSKGQQGFGVITNWAAGAVHPYLSLAASNGGSMLNADKTAGALTSPEVGAVAALYQRMIKDGSTVPSMSAANANTTGPFLDNFTNEKTAMIIMANWWESALKQGMGNNFSNIATAPIPTGPSGTKSSAISYSWLTTVSAHATPAQQAAAWKFLNFLNGPTSGKTGSSAMGDILMGQGILPSRTSDLTAHKSQLSEPFIKTYVDNLPAATAFPITSGGDAASTALQVHIESLIFGKESPTAAMASANTEVDTALKAAK